MRGLGFEAALRSGAHECTGVPVPGPAQTLGNPVQIEAPRVRQEEGGMRQILPNGLSDGVDSETEELCLYA
jgi:hypothetical protein